MELGNWAELVDSKSRKHCLKTVQGCFFKVIKIHSVSCVVFLCVILLVWVLHVLCIQCDWWWTRRPSFLSCVSWASKKHQRNSHSLQMYKILWNDMCCSCTVQVNHMVFGNSFDCRNEQNDQCKGHPRCVFNAFPCQHLPAQPGLETVCLSLPQFPSVCSEVNGAALWCGDVVERRCWKMGAMPIEVGAHRCLGWVDKRVTLVPGVVWAISNLPAAPYWPQFTATRE